jgi:biopolymer transport protein ExbD
MAAKIGGSGGDKHTIEQTEDINITPFIDILLVLMIIFMVAAPMATVSIRLDLPPAQPPTNPTEEKERVNITIQDNGQLFIADQHSSIDNLAADV